MRASRTALVVAAVAVVAIVGLADALRGSGGEEEDAGRAEPTPPAKETTRASVRQEVAERLASRGIGGVLYATVHLGAGCRVEVIALPTLDRSVLEGLESCRIRVSTNGLVAGGAPCAGRSSYFSSLPRLGIRSLRGCAPAWRPDGRLTFVNPRGDVVELIRPCASILPCLNVVVPHSRVPKSIVDLAWLEESRLAALVDGADRLDRSVAVFEDGRLVSNPPPCCPVHGYLRAVAGLVLLPSGPPSADVNVLAFDASGRYLSRAGLPSHLADGRAFTASPDGRWIASTLGDSVQIYRAGVRRPPDPIALDLDAVDLGWVG